MNKIWIELNKADTFEEAQVQCDLANKMLKRLGLEHDTFVASNHQRYTGTFYNHQIGHGSYTELDDRGQWFNLDYLANEEVSTAPVDTTPYEHRMPVGEGS